MRVADSKENVMLMRFPRQPVPRFHLVGEGEWSGASYKSLQFENSDTHGHEDQKVTGDVMTERQMEECNESRQDWRTEENGVGKG